VTNCIHSNGQSADSHGALFYFSRHFTRINPSSKSKIEYDRKMQKSMAAQINHAQKNQVKDHGHHIPEAAG